MELLDTSVWWIKERLPALQTQVEEALEAGRVATCAQVKLELLYSARDAREFHETRAELDLLEQCPIGPDEWERAIDVYAALAAGGGKHQRSVAHGDLLIAAAAERAGATVVHYDRDYDAIATITGQPVRWAAPRGSL